MARFNADGTVDSAFGSGGRVVSDFGAGVDARANAIAIDPRFVAGLLNRAQALKAKGEAARALADYDRVITLDPGRAIAFRHRMSPSPKVEVARMRPDKRSDKGSYREPCSTVGLGGVQVEIAPNRCALNGGDSARRR